MRLPRIVSSSGMLKLALLISVPFMLIPFLSQSSGTFISIGVISTLFLLFALAEKNNQLKIDADNKLNRFLSCLLIVSVMTAATTKAGEVISDLLTPSIGGSTFFYALIFGLIGFRILIKDLRGLAKLQPIIMVTSALAGIIYAFTLNLTDGSFKIIQRGNIQSIIAVALPVILLTVLSLIITKKREITEKNKIKTYIFSGILSILLLLAASSGKTITNDFFRGFSVGLGSQFEIGARLIILALCMGTYLILGFFLKDTLINNYNKGKNIAASITAVSVLLLTITMLIIKVPNIFSNTLIIAAAFITMPMIVINSIKNLKEQDNIARKTIPILIILISITASISGILTLF